MIQILMLGLAQAAHAQVLQGNDDYVLPEISVLGTSDSGRKSITDFVPTVSELSGNRLNQKRQATIGETLSQEAGVNSSYFGPNASRPVIRGLDGERVRILQNGIGSMDASGASPDHAVSADPFSIDRVEIVRGSAALLYGSSAIGGVVNMVDGRIPEKIKPNEAKVSGRFSSVDSGGTGLLSVNQNRGKLQAHADVLYRKSGDTSTPVAGQNPIANSANQAFDGGLGGSYVFDSGFAGASYSSFFNKYGTVAAPDVTIDLQRRRIDVATEVSGIRFRSGFTHYQHQELEGTAIGTTFLSRAAEGRLEAKHRLESGTESEGALEGILGAQGQYTDFQASGEEAFLPGTKNTNLAVFAYEELKWGNPRTPWAWTPTLGARIERAQVSSDAATRIFIPKSFSLGLLYRISTQFTLGIHSTSTERAPNYQELFADGNHVATGIEENGDLNLAMEKAKALELSLRRKTQNAEGRFSVYAQNFSTFVALVPTGMQNGDGMDIYDFRSIHARIYGAELEYRQELANSVFGGKLEVEGKMDFVRGVNLSQSVNLPRISPIREMLALEHRANSLRSRLELQYTHLQTLSAPGETHTPGYFMMNLGFDRPFNTSFGVLQATLRLNNVLDTEARNHVSFLKDRAPLPGRNLILSLTARI